MISYRVSRRTALFACIAGFSLLCCNPAASQEITASIIGRVIDGSDAAIAGATVIVSAVQQGLVVRTLKTNGRGDYAATLLPVGLYSVTVDAGGFKQTTKQSIQLTANQKYTADFQLQIGEMTQKVSVESTANQVELQSAQQSGLISGTQVRELSLNNRQFTQLVALQPGVVSNLSDSMYVGASNPLGGNNVVNVSINGTRASQNSWLVDGADNVDRGANLTLQQFPSIDAIEEIKINRSPYSAEFGRAAGGQISVITRSGTNNVHGGAYEFFRNDQLNGNNYFNNRNGIVRPPLRYNNFGYTLGGPVILPHIYNGRNRTFFFFSEEFRRVINYAGSNVQLPTMAERQGIFPVPVCVAVSANGATCTQTSTRITNINPIAAQYLQDIYAKVPAPQSGNNLYVPVRGIYNAREEIVRLDHNFSEKFAVSGRLLWDSIPTTEPSGYSTGNFTPGLSTTQTNSPGHSLVIRATNTISPTFYNEVGWAYSYGGIFSTPIGLISRSNSPDVNPPLVYPGNPGRIPTIGFSGALTGISGYGPYKNFSHNHSIFDNVSKQWGNHSIKMGVAIYLYRKYENQRGDNAGSFNFGTSPRPNSTGTLEQAFANFLLGNVTTYSQTSVDLAADMVNSTYEGYIQDDYRIKRNLTFNLGIRYSNFRPTIDQHNLLTNFVPSLFNPANAVQINALSGNRIAGTGDPFNGMIQGGINSPWGSAVFRSNNHDLAPRFGFAWDPFKDGKTAVRGGYGIFFDSTLVGSLEQNLNGNPTNSFTALTISNTRLENPAAGTTVVSAAPPGLRAWEPEYTDPYVQQWSFDIQRQLPSDAILSVAYVGTKGTHLIGIADINQVYPGVAAAAGLVPAGGYLISTIEPRLNPYRPYPGYGSINMIESRFNSNYNGLQVNFNKRFSRSGGTVNVAYTFSKALTNNPSDRSDPPQNSYDVRSEYALSPLDRRHVLTASYVYELPFFRNSHSFRRYLLGGWELSGIFTWNTGLPQTVTSGTGLDPAGLGTIGGRPDAIGDPNAGPGIQTVDHWFNTAGFADVPVGQYRPGNAGRSTITGPGITRWDFSLFKEFSLIEGARLQIRGESFNVLNHTNFFGPNTVLGNANFGMILSAHDPRQIQLGAKLIF